MRLLILATLVAAAVSQNTLRQCISDFRETTQEFGQMMRTMMQDKEACHEECKSQRRLPQAYEQCMPPPEAKEEMKQGMQMFQRALDSAAGVIEGFLNTGPSSGCSNNPRQFLSSTLGAQKDENQHLKGHMCKMAFMTRFFPEDSKDCMCKCMIRKWVQSPTFQREGLQIVPMVDQKLAWLNGGPLPESMKKHDPRHAAKCVFDFCAPAQIRQAIQQSGLERHHQMMKGEGPMAAEAERHRAMFRQGCECLERTAQSLSVPGAPVGMCARDLSDFSLNECRGFIREFFTDMRRHALEMIRANQLPGQRPARKKREVETVLESFGFQ